MSKLYSRRCLLSGRTDRFPFLYLASAVTAPSWNGSDCPVPFIEDDKMRKTQPSCHVYSNSWGQSVGILIARFPVDVQDTVTFVGEVWAEVELTDSKNQNRPLVRYVLILE